MTSIVHNNGGLGKPNLPGIPRLSLRPRDASLSLGISQRTLWTLTKAGHIPHFKVGSAVLYSVAELERWLSMQSKTPAVAPDCAPPVVVRVKVTSESAPCSNPTGTSGGAQ